MNRFWCQLIESLELRGVADALARNSEWLEISRDRVRVKIDIEHQGLVTPNAHKRFQDALSQRLGSAVVLEVVCVPGHVASPVRAVLSEGS